LIQKRQRLNSSIQEIRKKKPGTMNENVFLFEDNSCRKKVHLTSYNCMAFSSVLCKVQEWRDSCVLKAVIFLQTLSKTRNCNKKSRSTLVKKSKYRIKLLGNNKANVWRDEQFFLTLCMDVPDGL
jgi:hypothetical protein